MLLNGITGIQIGRFLQFIRKKTGADTTWTASKTSTGLTRFTCIIPSMNITTLFIEKVKGGVLVSIPQEVYQYRDRRNLLDSIFTEFMADMKKPVAAPEVNTEVVDFIEAIPEMLHLDIPVRGEEFKEETVEEKVKAPTKAPIKKVVKKKKPAKGKK